MVAITFLFPPCPFAAASQKNHCEALAPVTNLQPNNPYVEKIDVLLSGGYKRDKANALISFLKGLSEGDRHLVFAQRMDQIIRFFYDARDYWAMDKIGDLVFFGDRPSRAIRMTLRRAFEIEKEMFQKWNLASVERGGANVEFQKALQRQEAMLNEFQKRLSITSQDIDGRADLFPFQEEAAQKTASAIIHWAFDSKIIETGLENYKAEDVVKMAEAYVTRILPEQQRVWQEPMSANAARIFVDALIRLPLVEPQRQISHVVFLLEQMRKEPELTIPLVFYLISLFELQGFRIPESSAGEILFSMAGLANSVSGESNLFPVRLLMRKLFAHLSGQVLVTTHDDIRELSRTGTHGLGVLGILREEIHNNLSEHNIILLERTLEYYRSGDPEVLFEPNYKSDVYPFSEKMDGMTVFPREDVLDAKTISEEDERRRFIRLLDERLPSKYGRSFLERLRNVPEELLAQIYQGLLDEVPEFKYLIRIDKKGNTNVIKPMKGSVAAYLYVYRALAKRFHKAGEVHLREELLSKVKELNWEYRFLNKFGYPIERAHLLSDSWLNNLEKVVDEMTWLQGQIRKGLLSQGFYDPEEMKNQFTKEYGRDDSGNAVGGARIRDEKFLSFHIDYLMSRFEEFLRARVNDYLKTNGNFGDETKELFKKLSLLACEMGFVGLDIVDNSDYWIRGDLTYAEAHDVGMMIAADLDDFKRYISDGVRLILSDMYAYIPEEEVQATTELSINEFRLLTPEARKQLAIYSLSRHFQNEYQLPILLAHFCKTLMEEIDGFEAKEGERTARRMHIPGGKTLKEEAMKPYYVIWPGMPKEELERLLGFGKSAWGSKQIGLLRALSLGIPVPPAIIVPVQREIDSKEIDELLNVVKGNPQLRASSIFSTPLSAIRSCNYMDMPGQLSTVTNCHFNDTFIQTARAKLRKMGFGESDIDWIIADIERRHLEDWGVEVQRGRKEHKDFDDIIDSAKGDRHKDSLSGGEMQRIADKYRAEVNEKEGVPDDPEKQLQKSVQAVVHGWDLIKPYLEAKGMHGDWRKFGLMVETMVFGNLKRNSGSGILYSRDPNDWRRRMIGDFKKFAQGRGLADHVERSEPLASFHDADWMIPLKHYAFSLEQMHRTAQGMEFVVEDGKVWLIQTRDVPYPESFPFFKQPLPEKELIIKKGEGVAAGGGAFRGIAIYRDELYKSKRVKAIQERVKHEGLDGIVLITDELLPRELLQMDEVGVKAAITVEGGIGSHSADLAREFKWCAVTGVASLHFDEAVEMWRTPHMEIPSGAIISIDGRSGEVARGSYEIGAEIDNVRAVLKEPDETSEELSLPNPGERLIQENI